MLPEFKALFAPTIGFSGGLSFQYNSTKHISIRTTLSFERKGDVSTFDVYDIFVNNIIGKATVHWNYDYLTVPVLLRATFGNKTKFFLNAGPFFSYLMRYSVVAQLPNTPETVNDRETKFYSWFDTGITTGLGISVPLKEALALSFEIRNNLGLYNIAGNDDFIQF